MNAREIDGVPDGDLKDRQVCTVLHELRTPLPMLTSRSRGLTWLRRYALYAL